jgi:hypothetical protein
MPDQFWAVCRTQSQREVWAANQLRRPRLRGLSAARRDAANDHALLATIKFGLAPARCPEHEIEALRRRADPITGIIRLPPAPPPRAHKRGDKVKILAGPFAAFDAIHTGMTRRARELVLIDVLGGRQEVEVAPHLVEKLRPGASGSRRSDLGQVARRARLG